MAQVTAFSWHKTISVQNRDRESLKCQFFKLNYVGHSDMQLPHILGLRVVLHTNLLALLGTVDAGVSCSFCNVDNRPCEYFYYKTIHWCTINEFFKDCRTFFFCFRPAGEGIFWKSSRVKLVVLTWASLKLHSLLREKSVCPWICRWARQQTVQPLHVITLLHTPFYIYSWSCIDITG